MAAGECVASLAITEPDAGSDMQVQYLHLVVFMFCQQHVSLVQYMHLIVLCPEI